MPGSHGIMLCFEQLFDIFLCMLHVSHYFALNIVLLTLIGEANDGFIGHYFMFEGMSQ